ncbi:MAG: hypothetical protein AAB873_02630 [Patescibacteria group bacterium]
MEIKFFKKEKVFKKGGIKLKPDIYWGIALLLTVLVVLFSLVFGLLLFFQVNKEVTLTVEESNKSEMVNKERLDKVLNYFVEREKRSTEILNSTSPIVDPSL